MEKTFIFGHKNPDTDAICSSISLSYLKNALGGNTEPKTLGNINKETKFVLDYFGFKEPEYLNDVHIQIRDMNYNKNAMIEQHASIYDTYKTLCKFGVTGLPVVDKKKILMGYVNIKEVSKYMIEGNHSSLTASYDSILDALEAKEILRFDDEIEGNILAAAYKSETFLKEINLGNEDILIVGDRYRIMEYAVNSGIKLLILVNNNTLPDELMKIAKKNKVNVVSSSLNTFNCSNMIKLCNYIDLIVKNRNPIKFSHYDLRKDFVEISGKYGHTNYPIVDSKNKCLGMISLIDINNYNKKHVILVDHNMKEQTVDGIDEAEIVEVVDHHNLGTIGTSFPINFRSMPVGCTCTLIYKIYQESNVEIPKNIAGIMLSAILSDTLLFKSPTCTPLDKEVAKELAKIADVDIEKYGHEMFKAASSVAGMSVEEIINIDIKSFKFRDSNLTIGQVMTMDFDEINKKKDEFIDTLNKMCTLGNYKIAVVFITDIIKNGSYILFNEDAKDLLREAYGIADLEEGSYMDGVVSRKKQMLPPILEIQ